MLEVMVMNIDKNASLPEALTEIVIPMFRAHKCSHA
jgi:hypothetical protein